MQEHDELLEIACELRSVSAGDVAPDLAFALLRDFGLRVDQHRVEEARSLYDPLLAYAQERSAEFYGVLEGMLANAAGDWLGYLSAWTPDRMDADWRSFGEDTRRVLDRGHARLCLENELLYPLAMERGIMR